MQKFTNNDEANATWLLCTQAEHGFLGTWLALLCSASDEMIQLRSPGCSFGS